MDFQNYVLIGNEQRFSLSKKDLVNKEIIQTIHQSFLQLGYYLLSGISVEMDNEEDELRWFQVISNGTFDFQERCIIMFYVKKLGEEVIYSTYGTREECCAYFDEIVLKRNFSNVSDWEWNDITKKIIYEIPAREEKEDEVRQVWLEYLFEKNQIAREKAKKAIEWLYHANVNEYVLFLLDFYTGKKRYERTKELFEKNSKNPWLIERMADIEYYGYLQPPNYQKAYELYRFGTTKGNLMAKLRLAQMYRDGIYVEQDTARYQKMVEECYTDFCAVASKEFLPTIAIIVFELSLIEEMRGNLPKSIEYLTELKETLEKAYETGADFDNFSMKMLNRFYTLTSFNAQTMNVFDIAYVLQKPCVVQFQVKRTKYQVQSLYQNNRLVVLFQNRYYRNPQDFLNRATLHNERLKTLNHQIKKMEVLSC